jgi:hypothetical protein
VECTLDFPDKWANARLFEESLVRCGNALGDGRFTSIVIRFPPKCALMIDVALRLLSFCNQLIQTTRRVRLEFAGGDDGIMGYLNRMGFFDHLSNDVDVKPARPAFSGARTYRGANRGLVEIERFSSTVEPDQALVSRLADTVKRSCASRADVAEISQSIFTIFGELISNVIEHSERPGDAFAALQTYPKGDRLCVAVSDSGVGIMHRLRPALSARGSNLVGLNDVDLLVEIFREGLSRLNDPNRGLGLRESARIAMRFKAELDVRLPNQRVLLRPADGQYRVHNTAYAQDQLPLLWGTHIAFSLTLT